MDGILLQADGSLGEEENGYAGVIGYLSSRHSLQIEQNRPESIPTAA
jgi:hypothetical protein